MFVGLNIFLTIIEVHNMLIIAPHVLQELGASDFYNPINISLNDPNTEEEFKQIHFISDSPITWQMYQDKLPIVTQNLRQFIIKNAKQTISERCLKELQDSDYLMLTDNFSRLLNGDDWVAYRSTLRTLPSTLDYESLFIGPVQLDIQNAIPQRPPKIRKTQTE
jgi:hypothetical protein